MLILSVRYHTRAVAKKKIMTEAMSMKNMTEAIGPFFSWVFMVFMMSINNKNERND